MKQLGRYLIILVVVMVLWNTIVIKPLKIFTVYLHELGHALMAFIFGYGINGFNVSLNESGYTLVQSKGWFSSFMIANGGYLGSILFALLILYLKGTPLKKFILGILAMAFLIISFKYSTSLFTLIYPIIFTVFVLAVYMVQNDSFMDWIIDIIGIASVAYAVYDTFVDTILLQINLYFHLVSGWNRQPMTDAAQLAKLTHIPALLWGIIWLAIAILAVNATLLKSPKTSRR